MVVTIVGTFSGHLFEIVNIFGKIYKYYNNFSRDRIFNSAPTSISSHIIQFDYLYNVLIILLMFYTFQNNLRKFVQIRDT